MEYLSVAPMIGAALVVAGLGCIVLGSRTRTANQWRTSLDAYAEREIARLRRRQSRQRTRTLFTLLGTPVLGPPRARRGR